MPAGRLGHSGRVIGAGDDNVIDVRIAALELNKLKLRERGLVYAFRHGVFAHERDGNQMLAGFRMETDFQALLSTAVLVGLGGGVSDFRSLCKNRSRLALELISASRRQQLDAFTIEPEIERM